MKRASRREKGYRNYSLYQLIRQCRNSCIGYRLLNRRTRSKYLLGTISWNCTPLQDHITMVRNDQGPDGMISNFKSIVFCLLPYDLVAKRKSTGCKWGHAGLWVNAEVSSSLVVHKLLTIHAKVHFSCYIKEKAWQLLRRTEMKSLWEHERFRKKEEGRGPNS